MSKLKEIDLSTGKFEANGQNYTILDRVPMSRYRLFKKESIKLVYGNDIETLMKNCAKGYAFCDSAQPKPASAGIIFHNIMNGLKDLEDESREDPALLICALIIVRDGEDVGSCDKELFKEKIRDWEKAGYEVDGFFALALTSLTNFKKVFQLFTALQQAESQ